MNLQAPVPHYLPRFYYLLDDNDKQQYDTIRNSQKGGQKKTEINFMNDIDKLKKFIIRGNENDWKRGIVCGIYWLPESKGIAVNIHQLKIILNKSKSSLNSLLSKIGLDVILTRGKAIGVVLDTFPILKNYTNEVKQWTIRKLADKSPPSSPIQSDFSQNVEQKTENNNCLNEIEIDTTQRDECNQCNEVFFLCFC